MTKHKTGTREGVARERGFELLEAEERAHTAQRRTGASAAGTAVGADRQGVSIRDRRGRRLAGGPLPQDARSCSSITSCSGPTTRRAARPARRSRTGSTASPSTWPITTSTLIGRVTGAAREAAGLQAANGLDVSVGILVRRRFQRRLQHRVHTRSSSARAASNTTTGAKPRMDSCAAAEVVAEVAASTGTDAATYTRERPGVSAFVHRRRRRLSHVFHATHADWTASGACNQWLDRAPKGRNETGVWWRRHDE